MAEYQDPTPGSQSSSSADAYVGQLIAQAMSAKQQQGGGADSPIVPLWRVRPASTSGGAGSSAAADRTYSQTRRSPFQIGEGPGVGTVLAPSATSTPAPQFYTTNYAEAYWLDMSEEDRKAFMESAQREGFWKPSQGADGLVSAWGKAVSLAAQYNQNHDKGKWISPFEAIEKMSIADMAGQNLAHDQFSTETTYRKFTANELMGNAKAILQQELGRNPTASEMKAFTAAVNQASMDNPQTVTRQTTQNADGTTSSAVTSVEGGNFDPNAVILDEVDDSQEFKDFQAASVYYPALLQALDSVV